MHDQTIHILRRVDRLITERVLPARWRERVPLQISAWEVPDEPVPFAEAVGQQFTAFDIGQSWSKPWGTTWFRLLGEVPGHWTEPGTTAEVLVDLGFTGAGPGFQAEGTGYTAQGEIIKGLEPLNNHLPAGPAGQTLDIYLEAASNPTFGADDWTTPNPLGDKETAGDAPIHRLRCAELALRDEEVAELTADLLLVRELVDGLADTDPRRAQLVSALSDLADVIDPEDLAATAAAGRIVLAPLLAQPANASAHRVHAIGHAHIDSAWLWPTRETIRKCARTFSNVVDLMDADPSFTFACSSAQQYAWVKEYYPKLFARIAEKVSQGSFIPAGGMWVESDTNLPGGEALARQFVVGTNWFIDNLGVEPRDVWLPDSFGYSASMPQLVRAAGKEFFLTQKISWNDTNTMPHHTFWWEGIDGTRVFTHFPPVDTYNSQLSVAELHRAERQYSEAGRGTMSLVPYGFGDGGGGPTREMLARARRTADLEGVPRTVLSTPERFFTEAHQEYGQQAPVWSGEMYLEYHRGTYTSQHRTKAGNRRSESLLREAELWATTAAVRTNADYPGEQLAGIWRTVLLQQFHDILPGSSIAWVHREAEANYARVAGELGELIARSLSQLCGEGNRRLGANAGPFPVGGVAGLSVSTQLEGTADEGIQFEATPPEVTPSEATSTEDKRSASPRREGEGWVLENDAVHVVIDGAGRISSLVDKVRNREVVAPGCTAGRLQTYRDLPNEWDAWDIDRHYRNVGTELDGPESVVPDGEQLVVTHRVGESLLTQRFGLDGDRPAVTIDLDLDWCERHTLLKLGFGLDLHADTSASEIQFGHLRRPTHTNTSWDEARFEFVAHRWIHVGESGFGVALANDCSYGHEVTRDTRPGGGTTTDLRVSVVRAPRFPDPEADQGRHQLSYTLRVGADIPAAIEEGYRRNLPVRQLRGSREVEPLLTIDNPAIVIEAVKLAEDGSGDVVVRLYESQGGRAGAELAVNFEHAEVVEADLLERIIDPRALTSPDRLELRPFQLCTLRITRGATADTANCSTVGQRPADAVTTGQSSQPGG